MLASILFFGAAFVYWNMMYKNLKSTLSVDETKEIKPKLELVRYSLEPLDNGYLRLISDNYHFEFIFRDIYEVSTDRGWNKKYPENESVGLGIRDREGISNLSFSIDIRFLSNQSLSNIDQDSIAGETQKYNLVQKTDLMTNGLTITKLRYEGQSNGDIVLQYFFIKEDKLYSLAPGLSSQTTFTNKQLQEIDRIISSFSFL